MQRREQTSSLFYLRRIRWYLLAPRRAEGRSAAAIDERHALHNRRMHLSSASLTSSISNGCISRIADRLQTNYANQIEYQLDLLLSPISQMSQF